MKLRSAVAFSSAVAVLVVAGTWTDLMRAETCISPYIKGLRAPEKVMYLWGLPATPGEVEDFLAVIDMNLDSATYGQGHPLLDIKALLRERS